MQMCWRYPPSSRKSAHVGVVPFQASSYPVEAPASKTAKGGEKKKKKVKGSLTKESRGDLNINHVWLRVGGRFVFLRRLCDSAKPIWPLRAGVMHPRFRQTHLRPRRRGARCAGLGDNYSRDHLFPGMRYGNKRSRWKEVRRKRGSELWRGLEDNRAGRQHLINWSN